MYILLESSFQQSDLDDSLYQLNSLSKLKEGDRRL